MLTVQQWLAIEEPLDLHVRISHGSQLAFEFGDGHLGKSKLLLDLGDKARRLLAIRIE